MIFILNNVHKGFTKDAHPVPVLDGVSLTLNVGSFISVHGPSGSGKTTLLLIGGGLLRPDTGTVTVEEEDLYGLSPEGRALYRAKTVGFVFQEFHLIPYLTALENVLLPSLAPGTEGGVDRALGWIKRFGLEARAHHLPAELSTGERQRTALARALFSCPKLIIADEPTGNLDEENAATVLECLRTFAADGGMVILATHDARVADYAHQTLRLEDGKLVSM